MIDSTRCERLTLTVFIPLCSLVTIRLVFSRSLRGAHVRCVVLMFVAWCLCSLRGAYVRCVVLMFVEWCLCSLRGAYVRCVVLMFVAWCLGSLRVA